MLCETFLDGVVIPVDNVVGAVNGGWEILMYTLDFERVTAEKVGGRRLGARRARAAAAGDRPPARRARARAAPLARRAAGRAAPLLPRRRHARPGPTRQRHVRDGEARRRAADAAGGRRCDRPARARGSRRRPGGGDRRSRGRPLPRFGRLDYRGRHRRGAAARDRAPGTGARGDRVAARRCPCGGGGAVRRRAARAARCSPSSAPT